MVIIHFACINDSKLDGVGVVVPQHVINQGKYAQVAFVNINNIRINEIEIQFEYKKGFDVADLPEPFNHPDLVVFHELYRGPYIFISKMLYKNHIPYIIIPHGELTNEAQSIKALKKKTANAIFFRKIANRALAIQCLSKRELDSTNFGKHKFIGTNGIELPDEYRTKESSSPLRFIYIGRIDIFHKGLDIMIEAVADAVAKVGKDKFVLDIYGPGEDDQIQKVNELIHNNDLTDIVHMHGPVKGEQKKQLLLDSDVFIQTSRFEGMPMGILEAMSYGLPCLVTEGTTLGKLISLRNAGMSSKTNSNDVSEAIAKLSEENLCDIGTNARGTIEELFLWKIIANNTVDIYNDLLENMKEYD